MIFKNRRYHTALSPEELKTRLTESVSPRDSRGFFAQWGGQDPTKPYAGTVKEKSCRIIRLAQGGRRIFEVDILGRWEKAEQGSQVVVFQRVFPWLWLVGFLGFAVASLSAVGELIGDVPNWGEALFYLGIFAAVYALYLTAFRQVVKLNDAFLIELWDLEVE